MKKIYMTKSGVKLEVRKKKNIFSVFLLKENQDVKLISYTNKQQAIDFIRELN
jgi:hypothetical protein